MKNWMTNVIIARTVVVKGLTILLGAYLPSVKFVVRKRHDAVNVAIVKVARLAECVIIKIAKTVSWKWI